MLITRRRVLASGLASLTLGSELVATATSASAAAPATGKQAPSFYRAKLGEFEITQLSDGARTFPMPDIFVRNVSKDTAIAAAEAAYMPKGQVTVPFNPVVVNTGSKLVLIDAGNGPAGPTVGQLIPNMIAAGIDPKSIDVVILSHLHPDHINGIKAADGSLAFPNAEIMAPEADWAFWMSDDNAAKAPSDMMKNYFANTRKILGNITDKVARYGWGKEIVSGITTIEASGHTPGHTAFAIASGSARLLVQSDVTNIPELFLKNPEWHVMFDVDPEKAIQTRRKFYDMAAAEKALIAGFHFSFPSQGYVEKDGAGYRLVPVRWNSTL